MKLLPTSLLSNWRTGKKATLHAFSVLAALLMLSLPALLAGCSGGGAAAPAAAEATSISTPASNGNILYVNTSQTSIITDEDNNAIITATVVKDNVPQANVAVSFSTTAGMMSEATATTGTNGKASITLTSGPRASNQVATVTASSSGASASVPVQITGNTMTLTIPQANMAVGTSQTLTALLQDAIPKGIFDAPVTFTIVSGGTVISLLPASGTSDLEGKTTTVVTGVAAGTATILANSLGASAQINITVAAAAQVFEITSPTSNPTSMATTGSMIVTVNAPAQANVTFSTTVGVWNASSSTETVAVVGGIATATLTSTDTGLANITVVDTADSNTNDTLEVSIFAPASQAATIILDASQYNMPISITGTPANTSFITATVLTLSDGIVGNAQVNFTMTNQPGGGEKLNPGIATTDSSGLARTTFYSGTRESGSGGVRITATVAGTSISDFVDITITDRPGSIVLGPSTGLSGTDIYYEQEIVVMAADANGNPVANKTIYLKLWPTWYWMGYWTVTSADDPKCMRHDTEWPYSGIVPMPVTDCVNPPFHINEDVNMNLSLDASEDDGPMNVPDGFLTPPNSAAGTIPASVITDATGKASFTITYLKFYASWIHAHLEASTSVQMTESLATLDWRLSVTAEDAADCSTARKVFDSPFGYTMCN